MKKPSNLCWQGGAAKLKILESAPGLIERIQCRATRLIPGLAGLSYEERLKETGLYTLERRRLRGDMIEMFKIMKGIDKISADELFKSRQ